MHALCIILRMIGLFTISGPKRTHSCIQRPYAINLPLQHTLLLYLLTSYILPILNPFLNTFFQHFIDARISMII